MEASAQLSRPPWPASRPLRAWQQRALAQVRERPAGAFLASATPAAGKTTFGLRVAHDLLSRGAVRRVCVVAPTVHICRQWAAAAASLGIDLEPARPNAEGPEPADSDGVAVTYGSIAADPALHGRTAQGARTLLIADEPHHMGELAAWGLAAERAFTPARFRLLLSGTPFRSDNTAIPWVTYDDEGVSSCDFAYSYTDALVDEVCRPITFLAYDGEMEWVSDGRRRRFGFDTALPRAGVGPPAAHGAGPRGRLDRQRAARRRRPARRDPRRRPPRRGRPGGGRRQGARRGAGRPAGRDHREPAAGGHLRRPRRLGRASTASPPATSPGWSRC